MIIIMKKINYWKVEISKLMEQRVKYYSQENKKCKIEQSLRNIQQQLI